MTLQLSLQYKALNKEKQFRGRLKIKLKIKLKKLKHKLKFLKLKGLFLFITLPIQENLMMNRVQVHLPLSSFRVQKGEPL